MASLQLEIVTPDHLVLSKEVDYVGTPGVEGEFGIMASHIPFLSALAIGGLHYKAEGKTRFVFISGGFAEVSDNKVTVLAESAEEAECIDTARAEEARKRAEARLMAKNENTNNLRAEAALTRAVTRLTLASRV